MFQRGQKVECVAGEDEWRELFGGVPHPPAKGGEYTVGNVIWAFDRAFLKLVEIEDFAYTATAFRPIVDNEMRKLRELLVDPRPPTPVPQGEREAREVEHV